MTVDPLQRIGGAAPAVPGATRPGAGGVVQGGAFGDLLAERLARPEAAAPLRFSGHALERIQRRGIDLDAALGRLQDGVARAAAKGGRDSLVLVDETAFVVSVPNRTVITAVDRDHMKGQVFTNIDSAVIA